MTGMDMHSRRWKLWDTPYPPALLCDDEPVVVDESLAAYITDLEICLAAFGRIIDEAYQIDEEYGDVLIDRTFDDMKPALDALARLREKRPKSVLG